MNSYTLTERLRKARRRYCISAGAQALFYELVAICNEEQWSSVFICRNQELCSALNIAEKTLIGYRDSLAKAKLLVYVSGQANHEPCTYTLNGYLKGLPDGLLNGGKIYSSLDSSSGSRLVENVTDLNKTKRKTKTKLFIDDDDKARSRKKEIDEAVTEYFTEPDQNSNASFPQQAFIPDEKEKSSAKKEKELPTVESAIAGIADTAYWRNVIEHHKVTEAEREELFRVFYEQKEDHYRIRYPSKLDMVQHFFNWVPVHKSKHDLQKLIPNNNGNTVNQTAKNGGYRKRTEEIKHSVSNLKQQSAEFLRKTAGM